MAYTIVEDSPDCPKDRPVAVVNDDEGEVLGCHASITEAEAQITALVSEDDAEAAVTAPAEEQPFRMLLAIVGQPTSDNRQFDDFSMRQPPLTVYSQMENASGHSNAPCAGRIDFAVQDGDEIWGYGVLDAVGAAGAETIRLIQGRYLRGVSVDAVSEILDVGEDGVEHHSGVEIGAVTIVGFPAFRETQIELLDVLPVPETLLTAANIEPVALLASGTVMAAPPVEWFMDPGCTRREPLHVETDGRVWGHVYGWGECHRGSPAGSCVQAPRSQSGYSHFRTGGVLCDGDQYVPTGPITLGGEHAGKRLGAQSALRHYEDTTMAVADVVAGEDSHGIWVAGMIRPGTEPEKIHALRASCPSGDWRQLGGNLELIAVHAVNMPGFPGPRDSAYLANGRVMALIASGAPVSEHTDCGCGTASIGPDLDELAAKLGEIHRIVTAPARVAALSDLDTEMAPARRPSLADLLTKT